MSIATRNPTRIGAANATSGFAQTNEIPWTRGGQLTAYLYSGNVVSGGLAQIAYPRYNGAGVINGSDALLLSGAGRLNSIIPILAVSGTATFIYDSPVATSGGPFSASGHIVIGAVPANTHGGLANALMGPIEVDAPFFSGLCISFRSGMANVAITYTPEVTPAGSGLN